MATKHRKTVRHHEFGRAFHALTFSCYGRMQLLKCDERCRVLSECIGRAAQRHRFELNAFVFMPEHVHLLVYPADDDSRIADLLFAIKRAASFRIKQLMETAGDPLVEQLTIRERPRRISFRFWQEGPGYDRNICSLEAAETTADYFHLNPVKRRLCRYPWQWKWSSWVPWHERGRNVDPDLPRITPL